MDRRSFVTKAGRWFLTGGLLGTTGFLLFQRKVSDPDSCYVNPYCKRCGKSSSCSVLASVNTEGNERKGK